MKYLLVITLAFMVRPAVQATATVISKSQELIVISPRDLPEAAQEAGQSMTLHSALDGSTYLYMEQGLGKRLAVLDITDPAHIKAVSTVKLDSPSAFDFVRDINDSTTLICFRDNRGAAVIDFRRAKQPSIVVADALHQAGHVESVGNSGLLMVAEPRRDGDMPVFDYQVVDTSDPQRPKLLATVKQVQKKVTDLGTGAVYLLGADGLTVIRQPRVEEMRRLTSTYY